MQLFTAEHDWFGECHHRITPDSPFTGVLFEGAGTILITPDSVDAAAVETDDNLQSVIRTSVVNNNLVVTMGDRNQSLSPTKLTVHIRIKSLQNIQVSGETAVTGILPITVTEPITVKNSGEGKFSFALNGPSLSCTSDGSCSFTLTGTVPQVSYQISGEADVSAENLHTQKTAIRSSGSSRFTVDASDSLTASADGTCSVRYRGSPAVRQNIEGEGAVVPIN